MKKVVSLHSQTNGIARRRSSAVEHVICNLGVGGPNPSAGSKKEDEFVLFLYLSYMLEVKEQMTHKSG